MVLTGTLIGGAFTIYTYGKNAKIRHAEWLYSLYEKFYEGERYKEIRRTIDYETDDLVRPGFENPDALLAKLMADRKG